MARNLQLALQLLARDTGSKVLKQALQGISRDTKAAQKPMMSWRNPASRTQPQRFALPVLSGRIPSRQFGAINSWHSLRARYSA